MNEFDSLHSSRSQRRPGFSLRVEGPRVGAGRLSANDLATIIQRSQQALKRIGQVLYGEPSIGRGRKKRDIEELCELFVVGWGPGSAIAEVELTEPPAQLNLFGYIGAESLKTFLNGMKQLQEAPSGADQVAPPGFDAGVLQTCDFLGRVLEHGIDSIRFEPTGVTGGAPFTFDRPLRERVRELLVKPIDQCQVEKVGRLEVLDGHRGLEGRLWEPDGTKWLCVFKPAHLEVLAEAWLHSVKVIGEAVVEPTKERILKVESLLTLDEELEDLRSVTEPESPPFWKSLPLEELAERQGVQPVDDLDRIGVLWPVDDDPDGLLAHILDERSARRGVVRQGHDS